MDIYRDLLLDFDDVLIAPQVSGISSRADIDLTQHIFVADREHVIPAVCVANMDTTGTFAMSEIMHGAGGIVALHKFYPNDAVAEHLQRHRAFYSLGTKEQDVQKLKLYIERYGAPQWICVDVANAYTEKSLIQISHIRALAPTAVLMAGNVATPDGVEVLAKVGANIIKVGIGPGSVCETRRVAGVGIPQFSAVRACAQEADTYGVLICSDGGIRTPGDAAKALGAGASMVMIGGMFAGTDECEGEWEYDARGARTRLKFYGMSSREAMEKYHGGVADYRASEGRCEMVSAKGPAVVILRELLGGIRSAMTYSNAKTLDQFRKNARFVRVHKIHR